MKSSDILVNPVDNLVVYAGVGKPQKIAIVFDLENTHKDWSITVVSDSEDAICEVKILSRLTSSSLECRGCLEIKKGAVGSRLSWFHHAFLLNSDSQVTTIPLLKIEQDQVQCGHGVTVSTFDSENVEYLASRGISRQNAESMLYSAQYQSLCDWVLTK